MKWNIWCLQFCKMIDRICITTCQTYNTKKIEFIEQLLTLWISHCISFDVCTYYYVEEIKLLYRVNQIPPVCLVWCPLQNISWKQFTVISLSRGWFQIYSQTCQMSHSLVKVPWGSSEVGLNIIQCPKYGNK